MQHDPQSHQQDRLPRILFGLHEYRYSEWLAMQNFQIPNTAETRTIPKYATAAASHRRHRRGQPPRQPPCQPPRQPPPPATAATHQNIFPAHHPTPSPPAAPRPPPQLGHHLPSPRRCSPPSLSPSNCPFHFLGHRFHTHTHCCCPPPQPPFTSCHPPHCPFRR